MIKRLLLIISMLLVPTQALAITGVDRKAVLYDSVFYDERTNTGPCVAGVTDLVGSDNIQKAYNYFVAKGLKDFQSAGIVGNFMRESPGVNPQLVEGMTESPTVVRGLGYGIAQWTDSTRQNNLIKFASDQGRPVNDLGLQLDFTWWELNNTEKAAYNGLITTTTVEEATAVFEDLFERAGVVALQERINNAKEVLAQFGEGVTPGVSNGCSSEVPSGNAAQLAQELLDSPKIASYGRLVREDLEKTAAGQNGSAGAPMSEKLLQLLVAMAKTQNYHITALQSGGTGHTSTSNHYKGLAADLVAAGGTSYDTMNSFIFQNQSTYSIDELIFAPMPAGVPTLKGGQPFTYSSGVIGGHRDHIHVSVK